MKWVCLILACGCLFVPTDASAQTTQPTKWTTQIESLARQLIHPTDGADFRSSMIDEAIVRNIDGTSGQFSQLATTAIDGEVITARGYVAPATTVVSDIAADFSAASNIPDDIKRVMVPSGDKQMRQANDVALQWMTQLLNLTDGQKIGVIILRGKPGPTTQPSQSPDDTRPLVMVLIKGDLTPAGAPRITNLIFGDPRSMMK